MTAILQPVTETQREKNLDTLRGFAIIGVLFALFLEWDNLGILPGEEKTNSFSLYTRQPIFTTRMPFTWGIDMVYIAIILHLLR